MDSEVPDITKAIAIPSRVPIFVGTYSHIYRGQYEDKEVAIKVLRLIPSTTLHAMRRKVYREREVWRHLMHPNITPLCGFTGESEFFGPFGALVSPWYNNGDAARYLQACGEAMQIEERKYLWRGVVSGVLYLHIHEPMIIHGDLKPTNILIDDMGTPKLCDFGLVHVLSDQNSGMTTTTEHTGTERYLSRELVDSEGVIRPTTASDVHAMGCIGLEFLFMRPPYHHRSNRQKGQICMDILRGIPPAGRPPDLDETAGKFWDILEGCWKPTPTERMTAEEVLSALDALDAIPNSEAQGHHTSTEDNISKNPPLSLKNAESTPLWANDDRDTLSKEGSESSSNSGPEMMTQVDGQPGHDLQAMESQAGTENGPQTEKYQHYTANDSVLSSISTQLASEWLGTSSLLAYQLSPRLKTPSSARITCLLPVNERYLLLGSTDGIEFINIFPGQPGERFRDLSATLEGTKTGTLWTGEAVYQMSILENYLDRNGEIQGVLLVLVETEVSRRRIKSLRLYRLASILRLINLSASNTDTRPLSSDQTPTQSEDLGNSTESRSLRNRLVTDFVNLAAPGSRLSGLHVLFYGLHKGESEDSPEWLLAVVTKVSILIYMAPKGVRAFTFVKEIYTYTLQTPKSADFVFQKFTSRSNLRHGYPEDAKSLSRAVELNFQPQQESPASDAIPFYQSDVALFVDYGKTADIVRISDHSVAEIQLWDDDSPSSWKRSILNYLGSSSKDRWLPLVTITALNIALSLGDANITPIGSTTLVLMSRGRRTHIFTSPLPTSLKSCKPLRVLRWNTAPQQVAARLSMGLPTDSPTRLQVLGFSDDGVEIIETGLDFLSNARDTGGILGEGAIKRIPFGSISSVRVSWQSPEMMGYLTRGGHWDLLDTSSGRPETKTQFTRGEQGQGLYVWVQNDQNDRIIAWLG